MGDFEVPGGVFQIKADDCMLEDHCVVFLNGRIVYAGHIKDAPGISGGLMAVHPSDYDSLRAFFEDYKKKLN